MIATSGGHRLAVRRATARDSLSAVPLSDEGGDRTNDEGGDDAERTRPHQAGGKDEPAA
jgi:hypothetical protein